MKVDIVGTGVTASFYKWPEGTKKWTVASAAVQYHEQKIDMFFAFHGEDTEALEKTGASVLDRSSYPLDEIIAKFGSRYFTNSISYMIAYALLKGAKEIGLYGVDMEPDSEWAFERPSVAYWIGQAEARGVKVTSSSNLTSPVFLYGYDDPSGILNQLTMRKRHAEVMAQNTEGREKDQWLGKMLGFRDAINAIRT